MLTCQELTELVTDYLEGRMPLRQRMRVQMHLGMCHRCRAYLRQMQVTVRTLGKMPDEGISDDVRSELLECFRALKPTAGTDE
jgi:predicted anti-sigma-YlaC factor YlaD